VAAPDLDALLRALVDAEVEMIVVGGMAAVLQGAPIATVDLDIVHRTTPENVERLLHVLEELDAWVDDPVGRRIRPPRSVLEGRGQVLTRTSLGRMDLLCTLHDGRDFEALLPNSDRYLVGSSEVAVLDLPTLIEVKTEAGRPKDRLAVPVLVALLRERSSQGP
jgi:hypothetical protein